MAKYEPQLADYYEIFCQAVSPELGMYQSIDMTKVGDSTKVTIAALKMYPVRQNAKNAF
jgi:hypothetical protein